MAYLSRSRPSHVILGQHLHHDLSQDTAVSLSTQYTSSHQEESSCKAFETLEFETLFFKLSKCGICGKALDLIKSYLLERKMFIRANGCDSSLQEIKRLGVPQGSVLGPLFYIIYVNDMENILRKSQCIQFADDTTIFV